MGASTWTARATALCLFGVDVAQYLAWAPRMPEPMATHFGPAGRADGWMSHSANAAIHWGIDALALFIALALPVIVRRMPVDLINVPNRDHWLAPERAGATLDALEGRLARFGAALMALLAVVRREVSRAKLRVPQRLDGVVFGAAMGVLLTFAAVWLVALLRCSRHPAEG